MKRMLSLLVALLLPMMPMAGSCDAALSLRITRQGDTVVHRVPAEAIIPRAPTAEEMAEEWHMSQSPAEAYPEQPYRNNYEFTPHETLGFRTHEVSRFSRYDGDTLLWTTEIRDYWVRGWQEVRAGVLLWGHTDVSLDAYGWPVTAWMTLLSHEGEVLWSQPLDEGGEWEQTEAVLEHDDGACTAFGLYTGEDGKVLTIRQIPEGGRPLLLTETPASALGLTGDRPHFSLLEVLPFDDDFLLHLVSGTRHLLAQFSRTGELQQVVFLDGAAEHLTLTAALYHGGSLWLSGYLNPVPAGGFQSYRDEIHDVLDAAWRRQMGWGQVDVDSLDLHLTLGSQPVTAEFLVPRIRAGYTAVLLRMDPQTLRPLAAWTADGCLGGALTATDNDVSWDVQSITNCFYSPMTSSFTIGGVARIFRYRIAPDGTLLCGGETDEFAGYYR